MFLDRGAHKCGRVSKKQIFLEWNGENDREGNRSDHAKHISVA